MPSDPSIPAHIALAGLSELEMAIVVACLVTAAEPTPRMPDWVQLAAALDTQKQCVYRSRNRLIGNGVLIPAPYGHKVNPDPTPWIDSKTRRGKTLIRLAHDLAAVSINVIGHPSTGNTDVTRGNSDVTRPGNTDAHSGNSDVTHKVSTDVTSGNSDVTRGNSDVTRAPIRNPRGIEFNSNSIQKLASLPENSRENPEESRIAAEVRAVAMEHWGVEVAAWAEENAPFYDPKAFKAAMVIAARRQKKNIGSGGAPFDSPSGYIHAVAKGFETDGIPPGAFAPPKKLPGWAEPAWQPPKQVFTPEEEAERLEALAKLRALCGLDKPKPAPTLRIAQ